MKAPLLLTHGLAALTGAGLWLAAGPGESPRPAVLERPEPPAASRAREERIRGELRQRLERQQAERESWTGKYERTIREVGLQIIADQPGIDRENRERLAEFRSLADTYRGTADLRPARSHAGGCERRSADPGSAGTFDGAAGDDRGRDCRMQKKETDGMNLFPASIPVELSVTKAQWERAFIIHGKPASEVPAEGMPEQIMHCYTKPVFCGSYTEDEYRGRDESSLPRFRAKTGIASLTCASRP